MFNFEEIEFLERIVIDELGDVKIFNDFENLTNLEKSILQAILKNALDELSNLFKLGVVDKVGFVNDADFIMGIVKKLK